MLVKLCVIVRLSLVFGVFVLFWLIMLIMIEVLMLCVLMLMVLVENLSVFLIRFMSICWIWMLLMCVGGRLLRVDMMMCLLLCILVMVWVISFLMG